MRSIFPLCALLILGCEACTPPQAPTTTSAETTTAPQQAAAPEASSTVDSLLSMLGPLEGKVVAEFPAGGEVFAWHLVRAGARVLAIVDNPAQGGAMEARKKSEGIGDDRLLVRVVAPGAVGLGPNEVDLALITREYSTLGDRQAWFTQLMAGIKAPHLFYLVNYLPTPSPEGPPLNQRMGYEQVADELGRFGVGDVGIHYRKLPYRYILFGAVPPTSD
ncbi:MAG: hypothetical protein KBH07_04605 [Flavobacteriales bacterium]|nr:hypothetical protein [Flavobacteriales bacterium]MBP9080192.1 hypothetical protein [Flavobacteriales bacterium]